MLRRDILKSAIALAASSHLRKAEAQFGPSVTGSSLPQLNTLILSVGQSLAEFHIGGGNITLTQEGNSQAFGALGSTTLYPLISTTAALAPSAGDGENPMYGICGFLYDLLLKENGIIPANSPISPITVNNALGSTSLAQNAKGTTRYGYGITQTAQMKTLFGPLAQAWGEGWEQGEQNSNDTCLAYYTPFVQLARDYANDILAILTGQTFDPVLCTYQTNSRVAGAGRFGPSRAQHLAAIDYFQGLIPPGHIKPSPVLFSTPNYFMDHTYDTTGVHIPARDAKWLGGYIALALKRFFYDKVGWPPQFPIAMTVSGNSLLMKYQMRTSGRSFVIANTPAGSLYAPPDGETLPAQPFGGWSGVDTNTSQPITIVSTAVAAPDTIAINLNTPPVVGMRLDYAQGVAFDMNPFAFMAGNFRDDYGLVLRYDALNRPMHNWLPGHGFILDNSPAGFSMDRS